MARKVFGPTVRIKSAEIEEPVVAMRKPLARGGAGAPRYIQSSADAFADRSHEDIPVNQIQASAIDDRIDLTEDLQSLMDSIEANGQQIPIIVRIVNGERPYEIVAGRRRLEAMRRLGRATVAGFVTRMTDDEAFVAQGIENSARLETSFIERARTAVKAMDAGYSQDRIGEFLASKQSMISMMTSIYRQIGEELVVTIGPARGVGRRKWEQLGKALDNRGIDGVEAAAMVDRSGTDSVARFHALLDSLTGSDAAIPPSAGSDGRDDARRRASASSASQVRRRRRHCGGAITSTLAQGRLAIRSHDDDQDGFLEYVAERLDALREDFDRKEAKR